MHLNVKWDSIIRSSKDHATFWRKSTGKISYLFSYPYFLYTRILGLVVHLSIMNVIPVKTCGTLLIMMLTVLFSTPFSWSCMDSQLKTYVYSLFSETASEGGLVRERNKSLLAIVLSSPFGVFPVFFIIKLPSAFFSHM